ncbi:hypothetical protein [Pasteurella multocida]|uniref:hypothetical protein n=1 Tax=Pasteurella multocida TaxID=747 RepID=UPI00230002F0|nr:hypothetical protein [Pasteurella multocida]MDA5609172.1 hypothetical protein [Pasteurella multocida subsp. multocida]MDA5616693.1 hypothetical protein [Pasteurella multocida]MDA5626712.1 hypothetical protein [Pasteurella multocida]
MNTNIFTQIFTENLDDLVKFINDALITKDTIGSVLRMHLLCEKIIETYICAICNQANLFGNQEKTSIIIECDKKLSMAKNLGLHNTIYNLLKNINSIRNNLAHNILSDPLPNNRIESSLDLVKNFMEENQLKGKFGITIFDTNEKPIKTITQENCENNHEKFLFVASQAIFFVSFDFQNKLENTSNLT